MFNLSIRTNNSIFTYYLSIITTIIMTISISLCIIILSIKFTISFKQLYYQDIDYLKIEQSSDLSKEEIKKNYDYLVSFILNKTNTNEDNFKIPSFPSSKKGKIHFFEVREIIIKLNFIFPLALLISIICIIYKLKHKNYKFLKYSSITLFLTEVFVVTPLVLDFNKSFDLFHKILFNNDYWLFNKKNDPVITILPKPFFLHSALLIIFLISLCSLLLFISYLLYIKKIKDRKI